MKGIEKQRFTRNMFKFYKEDIGNYLGSSCPNWDKVILDHVLHNAKKIKLTAGPTTRELNSDNSLPYELVDGNSVYSNFPWLYEIYKSKILEIAEQNRYKVIPDEAGEIVCAERRASAVNLNIQKPGMRYDAHIDSNSLQGLLYVTTHDQGGELVVANNDVYGVEAIEKDNPTIIRPKKGDLYFFDARKHPHYVREIPEGIRVAVAMNFYTESSPESTRPSGLDYAIGLT